MTSINQVTLLGNLGRDAEIRHTQSGDPVATLNLATNEKWTDRTSGEQQERTEWHRIVVFGWQADMIQKVGFRKGDSVFLQGKLVTRKWEDQSGQERYTTEVVVQGFNNIRKNTPLPRRDGPPVEDHPYAPSGGGGNEPPPEDLDDEIPF